MGSLQCAMSDEYVVRVNQVSGWMADSRSANGMARAMALGRAPNTVKTDMLIVLEWKNKHCDIQLFTYFLFNI